MTLLLATSAALISFLTLYSLAHYFCAASFLIGRPQPRTFADFPDDESADELVVPRADEGAGGDVDQAVCGRTGI